VFLRLARSSVQPIDMRVIRHIFMTHIRRVYGSVTEGRTTKGRDEGKKGNKHVNKEAQGGRYS
jgi:hypothetical protein